MLLLATAHRQAAQAQKIGPTQSLITVNAAANFSAALTSGGRYGLLCAETDIYLRQGGGGLTVNTTDRRLAQNEFLIVNADDATNNYVGVLTATGVGGYLRVTRLDKSNGSVTQQEAFYWARVLGPTVNLAIDNVVRRSPALAFPGRYAVRAWGAPALLAQGDGAVAVADPAFRLPGGPSGAPGFVLEINVDDATENYLSVVQAVNGQTGNLQISRIDAVM